MRIRAGAVLLMCCLAIAGPALSQPRQAELAGTIRDDSGGAVVGAVVTVRSVASGVAATAVTDGRGAYRVPALVAGDYVVEASRPGFRSEPMRISIGAAESRTLDLTVAVASVAETVTVTRADQELAVVPQAIDVVTEVDVQPGQRRVSLSESLRGIPGVFAHDRGNYSESFGVRLSLRAPVRGVGIGVRGVQMVQDGVPLTLADGTTQPTNIDLGSAGRIEVIRGPSAVLYGNSAGGVVTLSSEIPPARALLVQPDLQFGSEGYQRQQVKLAGTSGRVGYLVNASRMETDGFRQHSHAESRQANVVVRAAMSASTDVRGVFNLFDMPFAESPSTVGLEDARLRPRAVRQIAIDQGFGEASTQGQGGLTMEHRFAAGGVLRATGWGMWRDVWNPIPGRVVDLWRTGGGFRTELGGSTTRTAVPITWIAGIDTSLQRDDSLELANEGVAGGGRTRTGDLLVDQLERVRSLAPFGQVTLAPHARWTITAGLRYDNYRFEADDHLLANGDQSGGRTLDAFSPTVGVTYAAMSGLNVYGNAATAYETPTTQELSNRPTGEGGFNTELEPEDLVSYEGGVRGFVPRWRLRFDVAGYVSTLKNALVQYQREDEQDFYRNAGESSRKGVELVLEWRPAPRLAARIAYTYQRFRFVRFATDAGDYSGHREPGAPPQQLFGSLSYEAAWGLRATADARWVDAYPANNANTFSNWAFTVVDVRLAWTRGIGWLGARPFLGIDNLFDERYNGSIVPNAFGDRFYEPSAGRALYGGLTFGR
ncbi:MAG: TonB-dependent receptor [Acidobacteria bacterium]|nr:TonB-dependent receptor [Acidobacteriota bacterium]